MTRILMKRTRLILETRKHRGAFAPPTCLITTKIGPRYVAYPLACCLAVILAGRLPAQTFTPLHSFGPIWATNGEGVKPVGKLVLAGNTLYGTTAYGGKSDNGTVFAVNTNGTGFTNLHSFAKLTNGTNSDGATPQSGLIVSGNTLYGTTRSGGSFVDGTVFAVNTDGTGFTNLHSFIADGSDGNGPHGGLILSGNTLYGTTVNGGSLGGGGTVFTIRTDGTGYTNLHSFTTTSNGTNSEGAGPFADLVLSGNTLYGTTAFGGNSGNGTVFACNTNGTGFTNLHSFAALSDYTNSDGAEPWAGLVLSGSTLYGTTTFGGSLSNGTMFAIQTDGTGFTNLHSFDPDSDGAGNWYGLVLSGNTLYGTAVSGGSLAYGTVFAGHTDGSGFTSLHNFTVPSYGDPRLNSDGANPETGLILSGNTLYGTAYYGGSFGSGTVFSLLLPPSPQLAVIPYAGFAILAWTTNSAMFTLQSATNLVPSAVWSTVLPPPVVVGEQNIVIYPMSAMQQFFRLSR
jgi:uncharacterized repeat protein (TIGR03803 family)